MSKYEFVETGIAEKRGWRLFIHKDGAPICEVGHCFSWKEREAALTEAKEIVTALKIHDSLCNRDDYPSDCQECGKPRHYDIQGRIIMCSDVQCQSTFEMARVPFAREPK